MKYLILSMLAGLMACSTASAQTTEAVDNTPYKIVMQLTSADTAAHGSTIRNIRHALIAAPKSKIEVVCHGKGLSFLVSSSTLQAKEISQLKAKGVVFAACENTMRAQKVKKEDLVPEAITVPSGVIEIVKKQHKKWAYLKAG